MIYILVIVQTLPNTESEARLLGFNYYEQQVQKSNTWNIEIRDTMFVTLTWQQLTKVEMVPHINTY